MKTLSSGFTLVETVIATAILVVASTAVASLFTTSLRINLNNREHTAAELILSDKVEQLSVLPLSNSQWAAGSYTDYVSISDDGSLITSSSDVALKFCRTWQISATQPKTLTIIVYSNHSAVTGRQAEMIRSTVALARHW
jgi:prepilin-type N-terminal cleavage/methylation domain-containing protein